ncbi:hypothetical protein KIV56_04595 [Cryobacterium breve]|uniref:Antitoxin VbhA domain-containing protein n=1 Tax=Cryobacterium breve TaxID=1259258 RepID=A0ABY7NDZ5_9MICO|nr:hypothetical protein [Cryobacterium breve]WBM80681.1 hypothetical protein KIV56_04595 [Cryobacterium breve]
MSSRTLTPDEVDARLIEIEKSAELAGHEPNTGNVDRCRRILLGELTLEGSRAEIDAKYRQAPTSDN